MYAMFSLTCHSDKAMCDLQPRRHAVDEGWDGEANGYPDDGGPSGWAYEDTHLDSYARAERALSHAQAAILEQRSRLEKVRPSTMLAMGCCVCCNLAQGGCR